MVGITGTNGKTTTAHLIGTCLANCGARPAVVGTLGYFFEGLEHPSTHTSPEADEIQRVAAMLRSRGASHLVMEVSSIALVAERVAEMNFDVAVFTNLTQDHLDYHGTMEAYAAAKAQLFLEHRPPVAVINVDDPFGVELAEQVAEAGRSRVIRVSLSQAVEVYAEQHELTGRGMELSLVVAGQPDAQGASERRRFAVRAPFSGTFNISNVLCAVAVVEALGLDVGAALTALEAAAPVPGRLERCDGPADDIVALVDYAHTPGALERVLESIGPAGGERLWCVFGCGGDRDSQKRGPMGEAVARAAQVAIVTNDNPRSERPESIAEAVVAGLELVPGIEIRVELDRALAIDQAVAAAAPGDVVLVAGKGHEPYQIIGDEVTDFDDRLVLRRSLRRRRGEGVG
ncbi:MAG: UDP-N-acetylmuramoyl-L-alanyl-D-glutamate--2,6-diaminopimelate ligase [Deltaproteobacteria bacterium]|nr:MAG: UDP-N-acetylmuramoyl-L-alanyl-D-glutamate--2,6-diaminopimelate ligase [Deltaproteobacteria bacterium]